MATRLGPSEVPPSHHRIGQECCGHGPPNVGESPEKYRPLRERQNVVLTRQEGLRPLGVG